MTTAIDLVMQGELSESEIALLLTALRVKGETVAEIAGAAIAMRRHMTPIRLAARRHLIDTCGTGGDGWRTFNVSTAAALVTAAAGVPVAKHGNRAVSSRSGSADVLAALGVNIEAGVAVVERVSRSTGNLLLLRTAVASGDAAGGGGAQAARRADDFQSARAAVESGRRTVSIARRRQVASARSLLAEALALLGTTRAMVVTGEGTFRRSDDRRRRRESRKSPTASFANSLGSRAILDSAQSPLDDLLVDRSRRKRGDDPPRVGGRARPGPRHRGGQRRRRNLHRRPSRNAASRRQTRGQPRSTPAPPAICWSNLVEQTNL